MANKSYILKSVKAIEFYDKNPSLDFNNVNELFIDLIQNITNTIKESISVNEVKALLNTIHKKVETLEENTNNNNKLIQMTYDNIGEQKKMYIHEMKDIIQNRKQDSDILSLIRELNSSFLDKTTYSILQQFPKLTTEIKEYQKSSLDQYQLNIQNIIKQTNNGKDTNMLENLIQNQYQTMSSQMMNNLQNIFAKDSLFYQNNVEMKNFLEKQKNSTKKGKESEIKLETSLNNAFPHGIIKDKSGESKACDYLLERKDKCSILFENKDYQTNVPNEEIKKFIRDIEYQDKHGIMISQHSGIQNKDDFQIDIHVDHIMVFIHYGYYDENKIKMAVSIIDHLDVMLQNYKNKDETTKINMESLSGINKEYLQFIGQKKQLIESYKKQYKDHLKQLEDFEMPQLTLLLNSIFTNAEQLSFKCEICNNFNAKNKRALITHQNKCKKNVVSLN